ncbi:MAG: membrane protein insertase YidC [Deltaproteobacteria bacterium]|nr:membrane protein insertase YidC [Deltaproteobacteria bacterium]
MCYRFSSCWVINIFSPRPPPPQEPQTIEQSAVEPEAASPAAAVPDTSPATPAAAALQAAPVEAGRQGRDITVETNLFSGVISETGGGIKSFRLKKYKENVAEGSDLKELVKTTSPLELPLFFSWGVEPEKAGVPVYLADTEKLDVAGSDKTLTLQSRLPSGLELTRTMTFSEDDYLIHLTVDVRNTSTEHQLQGAPFLALTSRPFTVQAANQFVFHGPAVFQNGTLEEIKVDDLKKGMQTRNGNLQWVAYEDTYFMACVIPEEGSKDSVRFSLSGEDTVATVLGGDVVLLPPAESEALYLHHLSRPQGTAHPENRRP